MQPPLLVILGPTASGKSSLALDIASRLGGEIVNCDSMQMVRHLDIATAKPTRAERARVPHHLFDIIEPDGYFSAGLYMQTARAVCLEITARGHLPIVVGGTGLYIRALLQGLFEGPGARPRLRRRLEGLADRVGNDRLHALLSKRDPAAAARIEVGDRRRIVRALEVQMSSGRRISDLQKRTQEFDKYRVIKVGLRMEREVLYDRINCRVEQMFEAGLIAEVDRLLKRGFSPAAKGFEALGYREAIAVLQEGQSLDDAIGLTQRDTRRYAKRQLTWFRKEPDVHWLEGPGGDPGLVDAVSALIDGALADGTE